MEHVVNNTPITGYERKLLAGMLFVMLAFLPTVGFAMYCLSDVGKTENQLDSVYTKTLLLAEDLRTAKVRQDAVLPAFVLSGDQTLLDELKKSDADFSATLSELETMPLPQASKATLADISSLQDRLLAVEPAGINMKKGSGTTAEVDRYFRREALPFIRPILNDLDQFVRVTSETRAREKARANRTARLPRRQEEDL